MSKLDLNTIATVTLISTIIGSILGPTLTYRISKRKTPAEIDSQVSESAKNLADAMSVVVNTMREELSILKEKLDNIKEDNHIVNGKGVPEPAFPLLYEKITEIEKSVELLKERQSDIKGKTDCLTTSVQNLEKLVDDFMASNNHNVDAIEQTGVKGLKKTTRKTTKKDTK